MKVELYVLYAGYAVFYFDCPMTAALACSSLAGSYAADSSASPEAPHIKATLAPVSPRVERIVLNIPNARRLRLRAPRVFRALPPVGVQLTPPPIRNPQSAIENSP